MADNKAPRISAPKPPRRNAGKGEPPQSAADTVVVGNNTTTPGAKLADIGFKVTPEYRKNFRLFCATHDLGQVEAFKEAMADYMKKKGWPQGE
jgi:hypothetical protein